MPSRSVGIPSERSRWRVALLDSHGTGHGPLTLLAARRIEPRLIERAGDAGIMAWLLLPLRSDQVSPTFDLVIARVGELRDLRRALIDRKAIERAKG